MVRNKQTDLVCNGLSMKTFETLPRYKDPCSKNQDFVMKSYILWHRKSHLGKDFETQNPGFKDF